MKKGQQKLVENNVAGSDQVTSTVEDSQDVAKETSQIEAADDTNNNTNTEVTSSSPTPVDCNGSSDSTQLSSKEKLAKFSFEHKAQ